MKLVLANLLLFTTACLNAQSVDRNVAATSGNMLANVSATINFTIGEPIVGFISNETSIDQGFWAGSLFVEPLTEEENLGDILVYPNPVKDMLTLFTANKEINGIDLFSVNGQRVLKQLVDTQQLEHQIDMSHITRGVYVLRLFMKEDQEEKLFKIIKN